MNKKCIFCDNTPDKKGEYLVCNNCSVILFENDIDFETKKKLITDYFETITKQIEQKKDYLHFIDQKHFDKKSLDEEEQNVFDCISAFNKIKVDLSVYIDSVERLNEEKSRKLLYKLLILSKELEKVLGQE